MKKKNIIQLDPSAVHVRLGMCAAALVGTAAAVPSAEAVIITFNNPIPVPNTLQGTYINFATGVSMPAPFTGWDFNPYGAVPGAGPLAFYWNPNNPAGPAGAGVGNGTIYSDLTLGTVVGPGSTYTLGPGPAGPNYLTTGIHILGFRFLNEGTGVTNYGYLRISTTATTGFPATVLSWSFENSGGPITVVPEPATTALLTTAALVLGALGLRQWRRQRAA